MSSGLPQTCRRLNHRSDMQTSISHAACVFSTHRSSLVTICSLSLRRKSIFEDGRRARAR